MVEWEKRPLEKLFVAGMSLILGVIGHCQIWALCCQLLAEEVTVLKSDLPSLSDQTTTKIIKFYYRKEKYS